MFFTSRIWLTHPSSRAASLSSTSVHLGTQAVTQVRSGSSDPPWDTYLPCIPALHPLLTPASQTPAWPTSCLVSRSPPLTVPNSPSTKQPECFCKAERIKPSAPWYRPLEVPCGLTGLSTLHPSILLRP